MVTGGREKGREEEGGAREDRRQDKTDAVSRTFFYVLCTTKSKIDMNFPLVCGTLGRREGS